MYIPGLRGNPKALPRYVQYHVAGDFDSCEMKALLEEKFGSWHKESSQPDEVPSVPNTPVPQFTPGADTVYLVDRPGLTQVRRLLQASWMTVISSCCRVACIRRKHLHCQTSL